MFLPSIVTPSFFTNSSDDGEEDSASLCEFNISSPLCSPCCVSLSFSESVSSSCVCNRRMILLHARL